MHIYCSTYSCGQANRSWEGLKRWCGSYVPRCVERVVSKGCHGLRDHDVRDIHILCAILELDTDRDTKNPVFMSHCLALCAMFWVAEGRGHGRKTA
jgi:hypothetical protein